MTPQADAYRCFFLWKDAETLVVVWNQTFQVLLFKFQSIFENTTKPQLFVHRTTNFITGGLHAFGDIYLIFALPPSQTAEGSSDPVVLPSIVVFDPFQRDPILSKTPFDTVMSEEETALYVFPTLDSLFVSYGAHFFVSTQKQLWWIQPMDLNDRIEWFLNHLYFERALKTCYKASTKSSSILRHEYQIHHLGPKVLHALLPDQIVLAASLTTYVLDTPTLWEQWIPVFAEYQGLDYLLKYIPTEPPLNPSTYEYILEHYLQHDIPTFRSLVLSWPSKLFHYGRVIDIVEARLHLQPDNSLLNNVAIHLYRIQGAPFKEFVCHLNLKNLQACIDLIKENPKLLASIFSTYAFKWFDFCLESADNNLLAMVSSEGIQLLINNTSEIKPEFVLSQIKQERKFEFVYLFALFLSGSPYTSSHPLLLELLVEYQPDQLYSFLTQSIHYSLDKALELCIAHDLILEQVYVLSRIGQKRKALSLLLDRCHDIEKAIQFAKQEDDMELWDALVVYAQHHPSAWGSLFACYSLDPVFLLRRLPKQTLIPGLHTMLITLVNHYEVQLQFRQQCHALQTRDHLRSIEAWCANAKRGVNFSLLQPCQQCEQPLMASLDRSVVSTIINGNILFRHQTCPPSSGS